jgi:uncharacterized protein (TIGR02270 family)
MMLPRIVPVVVQQHVEDAAVLHNTRSALSEAPHVKLHHLRRFDDRLAAHLDGLAVAGEDGWPMCEAALEAPESGAMFTAAVRALEDKRSDRLDRLFALAATTPEGQSGLRAAFGWVEPHQLQGVVAPLLASTDPLRRLIGIAASAMHRVDPGLVSARRLEDADPVVRARAFRTAAEIGKRELVSSLAAAINDDDPGCQLWAAWAAVVLGDRESALELLQTGAGSAGPMQQRCLQLALLAMPLVGAHAALRQLAQQPDNVRAVIMGSGLVGDPTYVPWLIGHMADDKVARLAGESFSMITGVDLAWLDLERKPPEAFESGPTDNPEDADIGMDPDDGLPWPEQARVQAWWNDTGARFTGGIRHFMGATLSRSHCLGVLRDGYQRQRIAAAYHRCLLDPGTPLFEWRAPAWRQQRELAGMN